MEMKERLDGYLDVINNEKREKFYAFYSYLTESNKKFNLTSITDEKEVYIKHFLDSAAGEFLFEKNSKVVEIGSGAGFPSVVLKILREDLQFTLVESTNKKCEFLMGIVDNLGLSGVNVIHSRAEEIAHDSLYRGKFDCVTARAVARLNVLCEYCLPFLRRGGKFVAYKGGERSERADGERAAKILGGKVKEIYEYSLPEGAGERSLIVMEKIKDTPEKYPRGNGKERKQPL